MGCNVLSFFHDLGDSLSSKFPLSVKCLISFILMRDSEVLSHCYQLSFKFSVFSKTGFQQGLRVKFVLVSRSRLCHSWGCYCEEKKKTASERIRNLFTVSLFHIANHCSAQIWFRANFHKSHVCHPLSN